MRLSPLMSRLIASCAVAGAFALAAPASATTLTNTTWLVGSGETTWTVHRGANAQALGGGIGGFKGNFGDPPPGLPIEFWCYDLDHTFSLGQTYSDYSATGPLGGTQGTELTNLFAVGGSRASDADHSAAFQLAIWNIEYDTDLDVTAGSFIATGTGANTAAVLAEANAYLLAMSTANASTPQIFQLTSASGHQGFITPSPVRQFNIPEPPMLPLVLVTLAVAAFVGTRKMRVRGG